MFKLAQNLVERLQELTKSYTPTLAMVDGQAIVNMSACTNCGGHCGNNCMGTCAGSCKGTCTASCRGYSR